MTLKDIAKKLTTSIQTIPELVRILAEGLENAEAGSQIEVTAIQESGTKIATITIDEEATDIYAPNSELIYSTTERIIGKWIDGSAIYQKTAHIEDISITSNADTNVNISDYFTGLSKILSAEIISSDGNILPAINASSTLSAYSIGITYDIGADHIVFTRGSGSAVTISAYVTLRYTKSTT